MPRSVVLAVAGCLAVSACGVTAQGRQETGVRNLTMVVGNSPGGGYDTMARQIADVLGKDDIAAGTRVVNEPGAGGTVALQQLVNDGGSRAKVMTTGVAVVGAVVTNNAPVSLADTTPIARVLEEPMIIAVAADSPYRTLDDLVEAWRADPRGITAAGGAIGGPDYQQVMLLAKAIGIDPTTVNFVTYDGGGELLPAILGGKVAFTASGYAEWADQIASGSIRVLAVSGEQRLSELDAPTLREQGVDLTYTNWRGFVAPPGISEDKRARLVELFDQLHRSPEWQRVLERNGQQDAFSAGPEFEEFLDRQQGLVKSILADAGLR
ncbi:Bug family tripartite tricarboxylate transporter substrate binding protein [Prauserella cavernicola]|uniref:Bug family tripartite tricarboxylate transporter substrate binding protein n=1 Tax=Prauserella cavernicola TaxID=2800127 RepID=UPI001E5C9360|nr:tripartite tricarboxylate transporter substrate-binding protein [Prauserella cavernicola]